MTQNDDMMKYQGEAVAWMLRLEPGRATTADLADFRKWCREDPAHARAFAQTRRLFEAVEVAGENLLKQVELDDLGPVARPPGILGRRAFLAGALGASAVAAGTYAIVAPPLSLWPSLEELRADYRTQVGERRQVMLANGAAVDMNTQTSIALRPSAEGLDHIELIAGESLVNVKSQTLEVAAASGRVHAADAAFSIRRDRDNVTVTSLDGEVLVKWRSAAQSLLQGRRLSYSDAGLGPVVDVDTAAATSWREGYLVFHDTKLSDVIAEINRYRRGRIVVFTAALGRRPVNGRFYLDRLDDVAEKFRNAFGARVTNLPGGVVILS